MLSKILIGFFCIAIPVVLLTDLVVHLMGQETISEHIWAWSAMGWGRLIPFGLGFLSCHLTLGKSGNG